MPYIPDLKPLGAITTTDDSQKNFTAKLNVEVEMSDGNRIRANVFTPKSGGPKFPVLILSSPYGKDVSYFDAEPYKAMAKDVPGDHRDPYTRFEGPSPSWWCSKGYVIVYWDHRGSSQSPGQLKPFHKLHFQDYAEMIEWAADQPWSTGKVGMCGISYLGLNQWPTAALKPRGLAAMAPWEGMADWYRDACYHGGIMCSGLTNAWYNRQIVPMQYGSEGREKRVMGPESPEGVLAQDQLDENIDNCPKSIAANKHVDDQYYKDRMSGDEDYSKIETPLLSAGNWGGVNLHLRGNVLGFLRASSQYKFLRIHTGRHDLPFYTEPFIDWQLSFFDCFLKGDDYGGWKTGKEPKVRFAVREGSKAVPGTLEGERSFKFRDEAEWPLKRTEYKKFHLTADKSLSTTAGKDDGLLSYAGFNGNGIFFEMPAAKEKYEICGHGHVKLSMSLTDHKGESEPEIDVFLALRKLDKDGKEVWFSASNGSPVAVTHGWIRASHRALSEQPYPDVKSSDWAWPTLSHKKEDVQPIEAGKVYELVTELWPTNLIVSEGEKLVLEVSPKDPEGTGFFASADPTDRFEARQGGTNNIHFGSGHENYVVLPMV